MGDTAKAIVFIVVLGVGIGAFLLTSGRSQHTDAEPPARALAAAIQANDPAAAPEDTGDYVRGVRAYFGRVKRARFLDTHTVDYGSGLNRSTSAVAELLLRTKRGAAVVELGFESATSRSDKEDRIDEIEELEPSEVRSDLDERTKAALERGFARRGRRLAASLVLDGPLTAASRREARRQRPAAPPPPTEQEVERQRRRSLRSLECVKRAKGDIEKIKRCP